MALVMSETIGEDLQGERFSKADRLLLLRFPVNHHAWNFSDPAPVLFTFDI